MSLTLLTASEFRAYDVGGNELGAQSSVELNDKKYVLIPFSYMEVKKGDVNLDGDFTLLFGKVNGKNVEPIKLASNYKFESIVVKLLDGENVIAESGSIYIDSDVKTFSIDF